MVIHTFRHEYPISYVKEVSDTSEVYICNNLLEGGFCKVLVINDRSLFPDVIMRLTDAQSIEAFTDYREHFMYDDVLCVVMRYSQGITLQDRIDTEFFTLTEKLELARRVLERMILQEIPDYFLKRCASADSIVADSDMTLHFNYSIEDMEKLPPCTHREAMEQVAELLRNIFARESENYVSAELSSFLAGLDDMAADECTMIELYGAYYEMMNRVQAGDGKSEGETSIWHKLWEKIKKYAHVLWKLLTVLLLVLAALYLIFTIGDARESGNRHRNFDRIGTVDIK